MATMSIRLAEQPRGKMTEVITLSKALVELKRIQAELSDAAAGMTPVAIMRGHTFDCLSQDGLTQQEFEKEAEAAKQKLLQMIDRRRRIKTAVIIANGRTQLEVAGEKMTIAAAVERKKAISEGTSIAECFRSKLERTTSVLEEHNKQMNDRVAKLLESTYSKKDASLSKEDYEKVSKPFMESNEAKLVDPLNLDKLLTSWEDQDEAFLAEIDISLSETNARTMIFI